MHRTTNIDRYLFLGTAALLIAVGLLMERRVVTHYASHLRLPGLVSIIAGIAFIGACYLPAGKIRRLLKSTTIVFINTSLLMCAVEVSCRLAGLDFNALLKVREKNAAFPIYFRAPSKPVGDVFFMRHGPDSWTGRPLSVMLKNHKGTDAAYQDETEVTIRYDRDGFRNSESLTDWAVAVAGDSFTESGYLDESALFTGVLSRSLGKPVKNLGVTDTGNLSHACYLEKFGKAPSCRTAVLAFFEGNDIEDNVQEMRDLLKFQSTGQRPEREIGRESSFIKMLYRLVRDFHKIELRQRSYANAGFHTAGGPIPVTIADAPPSPDQLDEESMKALHLALDKWAAACMKNGAEPWLLYIPCKRRVFHGHLTQHADYPQPKWELNKLPEFIREKCAARNIRFVDATAALAEQAARGVLTFNTIYDTHLNMEGHRIVGETLAAALKNLPATIAAQAQR
jgi:hypothetical protein